MLVQALVFFFFQGWNKRDFFLFFLFFFSGFPSSSSLASWKATPSEKGQSMASVSAANLSTKAKIDLVVGSSLPAFSEEVISNKNPRNWNDLPEHILLRIFDSLAKEADNGRVWVSFFCFFPARLGFSGPRLPFFLLSPPPPPPPSIVFGSFCV